MINRTAIQQWSNHAPWIDNAQIEQDLIICRALVSIFSDEFLASQLAFRGGTALHKLYLSPQPRYSEDIDLVQIAPGPIKPIMYRLGFDLYIALQRKEVDVDKVLQCYKKYMEFVVDKAPSYKQYVNNMLEKMEDPEFTNDMQSLLRPGISFNASDAYPLIYETFIDKMVTATDALLCTPSDFVKR